MAKEIKHKKEEVGARIKQKREFKGLTQKKLAIFCSITPTTFAKMEKGEANITESQLASIARVLEVSTNYLLTGSDLPQEAKVPETAKTDAEADSKTLAESDADSDSEELVLTLSSDIYDDIKFISHGRDEPIQDTVHDLREYLMMAARDWIESSMKPLKDKMIESKTTDIAAILAGLSPEDVQKVLANLNAK